MEDTVQSTVDFLVSLEYTGVKEYLVYDAECGHFVPQLGNISASVPSSVNICSSITIPVSCLNADHMFVKITGPDGKVQQFGISGSSGTVTYTPTIHGTYTVFISARNTETDQDPGTDTASVTQTFTAFNSLNVNEALATGRLGGNYTLRSEGNQLIASSNGNEYLVNLRNAEFRNGCYYVVDLSDISLTPMLKNIGVREVLENGTFNGTNYTVKCVGENIIATANGIDYLVTITNAELRNGHYYVAHMSDIKLTPIDQGRLSVRETGNDYIKVNIENPYGKTLKVYEIDPVRGPVARDPIPLGINDTVYNIGGLKPGTQYMIKLMNSAGEQADVLYVTTQGTGEINLDSWTDSDVLAAKNALSLIGYKNLTINTIKDDILEKDLIDFMRGYGLQGKFFLSNQDKNTLITWLDEAANLRIPITSSYVTQSFIAKNLISLGYHDVFLFDENSPENNTALLNFISDYGLSDRYTAIGYDRSSAHHWLFQAVSNNDAGYYDLEPITKEYTNYGEKIKSNGQAVNCNNYGGIADTDAFVEATYLGFINTKISDKTISGISNVPQEKLESGAGNCTLTSITKILKYFGDYCGYTDIPPSLKDIYEIVRRIGVDHGYVPTSNDFVYNLMIYSPFEIAQMVNEAWAAFGYNTGDGINIYPCTFNTIKSEIDNLRPLLLNIAFGDYPGHTVTVVGYKEYRSIVDLNDVKRFVKIYDNWSDEYRYIDWDLFGINCSLSILTTFVPPNI